MKELRRHDARTFDRSFTFIFYQFHAPWVTACERRRDARPPEMQKFAHAIQALQTLVLLRAGAKLQLPRLTISHAVRLWELTRPANPAPSHRDSSGTLLRHSSHLLYY